MYQKKLVDKKKDELHSVFLNCAIIEAVLLVIAIVLYDFNPKLTLPIAGIVSYGILILIRDKERLVSLYRDVSESEKKLNSQGYRYYAKAKEAFLSIFDEQCSLHYHFYFSQKEGPEQLSEFLERMAVEMVAKVCEMEERKELAMKILITISYLGLMDTDKQFPLTNNRGEGDALAYLMEKRTRWLFEKLSPLKVEVTT